VRIHKKSVLITNIGEWEQNAGPKLEHQWAPGRSALECATAWCEPDGPVVPSEFAALFAGHQFAGFEIESVQPEHCIRFDNLRGGPRNADLAIEATDRNGRIAITVEAKADEPFDGTLDEMMMAALEARLKNPRSGAVRRIEQLTESLFTPRVKGQPRLVQIRYQLMTAVAGTLAYAQEIKATPGVAWSFWRKRASSRIASRSTSCWSTCSRSAAIASICCCSTVIAKRWRTCGRSSG